MRNALPEGSLEVVTAMRDFAGDSVASPVWESAYAEAVRAFRRPPDGCWVRQRTFGEAVEAVWDEPGGELIAGHWSIPISTASRTGQSPAGIALILQTRKQADHLATIEVRRRIACPR